MSIVVIMDWGLWKSLGIVEVSRFSVLVHRRLRVTVFRRSVLLRSSSVVIQSSCLNPLEVPVARQAPSTVVSTPIDLSDVLGSLVEFDD